MAALRQVAFYLQGGIGKSKQKPRPKPRPKRKKAFFRKRVRGGKGCFGKADFYKTDFSKGGPGTGRSGKSKRER
ncbi:hypothetical protein BMJ21_27485 [Sinorhizobium medicae]|nr:hypothetical protein BMJ21_27485 [Sinorhizobium medicae]